MSFTIQQIDAKIASAEAEVSVAQEKLSYWRNLRDVVSNPLFAELSSAPFTSSPVAAPSPTRYPTRSGIPASARKYGEIKRLTLECLPESGNPVTPQELAERISATGYVFKTKTPAISVNDTLNTLQKENKVSFVGKSPSNAGLWLKASKFAEFVSSIQEVKGQEAAEAAS
ncbi:MAG TPA: hypothetical protein VK684_04935 [Edaphobacter sp.]|jgi:hypothetical protein|nr:hypothetical protein [Edaphobacter sp.]